MSEDLTGDQIALLCEIGESDMAASDVAGRHQRQAHVTLCRSTRPTGASRLQSHQPETRGMVFDRMPLRRSRADQIRLATLPAEISLRELVSMAKLRRRIERDY